MPEYPPQIADLSAPRLDLWIPPRIVTVVAPRWVGRKITLPLQPVIWYDTYNWSNNTFEKVGNTLVYTTPDSGDTQSAYEPVRLMVQGQEATNKTDYRSTEAPEMSDYTTTRNIEYYLSGSILVTNVEFAVLGIPSDAVTVTYTVLADKVRLRLEMSHPFDRTTFDLPAVDSYTLHLTPMMHPQVIYP